MTLIIIITFYKYHHSPLVRGWNSSSRRCMDNEKSTSSIATCMHIFAHLSAYWHTLYPCTERFLQSKNADELTHTQTRPESSSLNWNESRFALSLLAWPHHTTTLAVVLKTHIFLPRWYVRNNDRLLQDSTFTTNFNSLLVLFIESVTKDAPPPETYSSPTILR